MPPKNSQPNQFLWQYSFAVCVNLAAFCICYIKEIYPHCFSTVAFSRLKSYIGPSVCGIILFSTVLLSTWCHEQMPVAYNSATVFSPIYIFLEIIGDTVDVSR